MMKRAAVPVLVVLALAACGGGDDEGGGAPPTPPAPPTSGLDARPSNTSCLAGDAPAASITTTRVFPSLTFSAPVALTQRPNDGARWYVVEKRGVVRVFANSAGTSSASDFINIAARVADDGERGLLGIAFHPDYPADPRVFLSYTSETTPVESRVSVFRSQDGGLTLDAANETVLLRITRSQSNHNGGNILFGPDRLLYIGLGDGGSGNDPFGAIGNGQNLQTILGKMLRINVGGTSATSYTVPSGNPFASTGGRCENGTTTASPQCAEIYAYGLRNPWRWSFDRSTGELWLGDVGQNALEEVDRIVSGGNYGWRCLEGTRSTGLACGPNPSPLPPVAEYDRNAGTSITGGYVYRGRAIPALVGRYVFADYGSQRIWHIPSTTAPTLRVTASQGLASGRTIVGFGEDADGELYAVDIANGGIYRIDAGAGGGGAIATQLSASGCGAAESPSSPSSGLIPYAPNAPFWSDGASKQRWIGLPDGQNITVQGDGDFDFPNGTVLRKDFRIGSTLVETRLFMRHTNGTWAGYTYEWNAGATDATRVVGGRTVTVAGQTWIFPSEAQCLNCHTAAAGHVLGLETAQQNGNFSYPQTGRTANQIVTLNAIQTLSPPITAAPSTLPALPDPFGTAPLAERARAYLHTNCSQCHRPSGPAPGALDFRYTTSLAGTNACNADPQQGSLGIGDARIIAAGEAQRSVLVARMNTRNADAMPPVASASIDTQGVQLMTQWINGLTACN